MKKLSFFHTPFFFYVEGCQKFFYFLSVLLSVSDKISKEQIL